MIIGKILIIDNVAQDHCERLHDKYVYCITCTVIYFNTHMYIIISITSITQRIPCTRVALEWTCNLLGVVFYS